MKTLNIIISYILLSFNKTKQSDKSLDICEAFSRATRGWEPGKPQKRETETPPTTPSQCVTVTGIICYGVVVRL